MAEHQIVTELRTAGGWAEHRPCRSSLKASAGLTASWVENGAVYLHTVPEARALNGQIWVTVFTWGSAPQIPVALTSEI